MATFAVNTPKGQVRLMDLPLDSFATIEEETGQRWVDVIVAPAASAKGALVVYRIACEHIGATPEKLTPQMLVGDSPIFEMVEDDLPEVYEGGVPKSEDDPETTGS